MYHNLFLICCICSFELWALCTHWVVHSRKCEQTSWALTRRHGPWWDKYYGLKTESDRSTWRLLYHIRSCDICEETCLKTPSLSAIQYSGDGSGTDLNTNTATISLEQAYHNQLKHNKMHTGSDGHRKQFTLWNVLQKPQIPYHLNSIMLTNQCSTLIHYIILLGCCWYTWCHEDSSLK
jgi:hypothetical protein